MTRHSALDLSGVNLYNENGGVVQGQICGQALMTKLLRKKGNKSVKDFTSVQIPLSLNQDATNMCLSPVGSKGKKIKFHKHNLYENMNMSSIDTESCSSDDIFSETSGTAATNASAEDVQAPAFVAQFDPQQLVEPSNSPEEHLKQQRQSSTVAPGSARKAGVPWSASLPAVTEEDSQSEQSSHPGIWRNGQGLQSPANSEGMLPHKEQEQGDPSETMDLLESDRIGSPRAIPLALASPPSIRHSKPLEERYGDNESNQSSTATPVSATKKPTKGSHRSKQDNAREAVDRRIRQAMEEAMHNAESEDASDMYRLASEDSEAALSEISRRTPTGPHSGNGFDPFRHNHQSGRDPRNYAEPYLPRNNHAAVNDVSNAMQELLLQQQMTLKEMSLQNSHYREELNECQEIFDKWRLERQKQRSTIQDLVKEKDAYATEASFLRHEMSTIRLELEALRKETRLQASQMQSPPRDSKQHSKQSPYYEDKSQRSFRHKQPQQESPQLNDNVSPAPSRSQSRPQFHPDDSYSLPPIEQSGSDDSPIMGLRLPPPPDQRTPNKIKEQKNVVSSPSPNKTRPEHHNMYSSPSPNINKKGKPLLSGLKDPNSSSKNHSVKFQDPPKSKEWTLFPAHMHDDRLLEQSYQDSTGTNTETPEETDFEDQEHGDVPDDEALNLRVPKEEPETIVEAPTPVAANGRSSSGNGRASAPKSPLPYQDHYEPPEIISAAYKYRLETMKKNRQQRTGRSGAMSPGPISSPFLESPERKRRGRSRTPSAASHR